MATYSKIPLSNSSYGKQILITSTSSVSATLLHTTQLSASLFTDEVYLYAYNDSTSSLSCSILWGGTTEPNDVIRNTIPNRSGRMLLVDGKILQNGLSIQAYAQAPNVMTMDGFVNRIYVSSSNAIVNSEVSTWITNLTNIYNNSASLDTNLISATDAFVTDLKNANIWGKMVALNTFPYSSYNSADQNTQLMLTPIIPGIGSAGEFSWGSSGGTPLCTINGYCPNGNYYINTGLWYPYIFSNANSHGVSWYHYTGSSTSAGFLWGAAPNYTYIFGCQQNPGNGAAPTSMTIFNPVLSNAWSITTPTGSYGFWSFSRTGANVNSGSVGNSIGGFQSRETSSAATSAASNCGAYLTVFQLQSVLNSLWYVQTSFISFISFHNGLTDIQTRALYNAVQKLRQNVGGGYV